VRRHPAAQRPSGGRPQPAPRLRGRAGAAAAAALPGRGQVHHAGRHRRRPGGPAGRAGTGRPGSRTRLEPGVPARGARGGGHAAPGPDRGRRALGPRRDGTARGVPPADRGRHAAAGHRPGHGRAGEGGRERLPGHQDLVHQRDGRGVRGGRGGRHGPGRRARPGSPDRRGRARARPRLRRRVPAQGHQGVPAPGRRTGGRAGAVFPG
jgi:hypothetical protein